MTAPNIPSQTTTAPSNIADFDAWLVGDGSFVFVLKLEPTDLAGGTATLYYSTGIFRDADAKPRLVMPSSIRLSVLNDGFGTRLRDDGRVDFDLIRPGQITYGGFSLLNQDGELDSLPASYGWGDADCTLLFGAVTDTLASLKKHMGFKVLGEPKWGFDSSGNSALRFDVKSPIINPNGPVEPTVFSGTGGNSGGEDLEGQSKPVLIGKYRNIEPAFLKDGSLGYMIDPAKCDSLSEVYQNGRPVGSGYFTDNVTTDGTFNLDSIPNFGPITCDAVGWTGAGRVGSTGDESLAANFKILVEDYGGAAAPTTAGLSEDGGVWLPPGAEARFEEELIKSIQPLGMYWPAQDASKLYAGELGSPEDGTSDQTYTHAHIDSVDRVASPPPAFEVRVGWQPLGTVLSGLDASGAVTEAEIARLTTEYRYVKAADATVQTDYPNAIAVTVNSSLYVEANASTLATELLNILKVKRDVLKVKVSRHPLAVWIGQIVTLDLSAKGDGISKYGLDTPKKFMVTGWDVRFGSADPNAGSFVMEVWG